MNLLLSFRLVRNPVFTTIPDAIRLMTYIKCCFRIKSTYAHYQE